MKRTSCHFNGQEFIDNTANLEDGAFAPDRVGNDLGATYCNVPLSSLP
jgi:hypothetical protein